MPACSASPAAVAAPPRYHRTRKLVQLTCFLVFLALPFSNAIRFDIPRERFYFAGRELWISEFGIVFFSLMFLMFLIVCAALFYGRVFCSYTCPQMIFSEASQSAERWLARKTAKHAAGLAPRTRRWLARGGFYLVIAAMSVVLAFVFISYFVEPRDLLARLFALDIRTAGGIAGATVTLLTFLDFTLVRQRFCTTVCPYGYLQGLLADRNTLLVAYRDDAHECIECKKCVRVCEMGIDIRKSPFQIECVHCGDCIDSCTEIMQRVGKQGLIHYTWGEHGETTGSGGRWYQRLGLRDAKRIVALLVLAFYGCGLFTVLAMRRSVWTELLPDRATLFELDARGSVRNRFRLKVANRGRCTESINVRTEGLPGARLLLDPNPIPLAAGEQKEVRLDVTAPQFSGAREVNHFRIVTEAACAAERKTFDETFLMPAPRGEK